MEITASANPRLEPVAKTYFDDAISKVRAEALKAEAVDGAQTTRLAYALADGAVVPADTHDAVRLGLRSLKDRHAPLWTGNLRRINRGSRCPPVRRCSDRAHDCFNDRPQRQSLRRQN